MKHTDSVNSDDKTLLPSDMIAQAEAFNKRSDEIADALMSGAISWVERCRRWEALLNSTERPVLNAARELRRAATRS